MDKKVDIIILITADSDQVSTVKFIKRKFPSVKLKVYFPPSRSSNDLRHQASPVVFLENHEERFKNAVMPGEVMKDGKKYTKPQEWKK